MSFIRVVVRSVVEPWIRSVVRSVVGGVIFHPLITTLFNPFGSDFAAATIRSSTATVEDWAGTIQTMAINVHRAAGHRWTGSGHAAYDH